MDFAIVEGRRQRGQQLSRRVPPTRRGIAIRHAEKTCSRAHAQSAASYLHPNFVEEGTARFRRKFRLVGCIADQVVTAPILQRLAKPPIDFLVALNEPPTLFTREQT